MWPTPARASAPRCNRQDRTGRAGARCWNEERRAVWVFDGKAVDEIGADFVIVLADHGSQRGADLAAVSAELLHRGDSRFRHAGERTAPAGMGRADDTRSRLSKKDRAAIGGGHANGEFRHARNDGVGAGPRLARPRRLGNDNIR